MSSIYYHFYPAPVGNLLLLVQHNTLIYLEFEQAYRQTLQADFIQADLTSDENGAIFCKILTILDRYFAGEKLDFSTLDFLAPKGTPFQLAVWQKLREIPYGKTCTYGEIAAQLDHPKAVRAVGGAVGRNPISILIPCHRVLGKNQTLTGFGGGLPNKRFLLQLENIEYQNKGVEYVKPKKAIFTR